MLSHLSADMQARWWRKHLFQGSKVIAPAAGWKPSSYLVKGWSPCWTLLLTCPPKIRLDPKRLTPSTFFFMQFGARTCEAWARGALPRSGFFVRSVVIVLVGIVAFSNVLDHSDILALSGFGDWPRLELADHSVFFRRTWGGRVRSGTWVSSRSDTFPCYRHGIPTSQLWVIWKTTHHSFCQQCRLRKWCEWEEYSFKYPSLTSLVP
jgi:hypothetical protein